MKIGAMELIIVFIVALIVVGPEKLPAYARKFGNALREFRKASSEVTQDIRESVVEPLEEAQRPLREAIEPLEDLKSEVTGNFKGVEKDLKNIGKAKPDKKDDKPASEIVSALPETEPPSVVSVSQHEVDAFPPETEAFQDELSPSETDIEVSDEA